MQKIVNFTLCVCRKKKQQTCHIIENSRIRIELQASERKIKHTEAIGHSHCMHTQYCALSRLARSLSNEN